MRLAAVVEVSSAVTATSARSAKVALLAGFLRTAPRDDVALVVGWLIGALSQRQIGVGWAALRDRPPAAEASSLTTTHVERTFTAVGASAGTGSQATRRDLLGGLFAAATADEQAFLGRLLGGDLRQGALAGVMTDAVARAAAVPLADVRRAAMLSGNLPTVAAAALDGGAAALAAFRLEVGRPVAPMLAQPAQGVDDALTRLGGEPAWEWKLDGVRIQVHRRGDDVAVFSRTLDDLTARLPEAVQAVRALPATSLLADGEAIALRRDGRPEPFQVTASRMGSRRDVGEDRAATPITPVFFDVLHLDGVDLIDEPMSTRVDHLDALVGPRHRMPRLITGSVDDARRFLADALARGHEGVVAKRMSAPYEAGRRGGSWLKVKPVHTVDLVVLAVEWGSGRRRGWLSNIHLGARDPAGGFVMLGKTFKGMTDAMLAWQTERFLHLAAGPTDDWVVRLRPEQVVEVAFDGLQQSSRYPGGVALRFARVVRYRDDKGPDEADTIDSVRALGTSR